MGLAPVQARATQASVWVQTLPSSQATPSAAGTCVQTPSTLHASAVQGLPSSRVMPQPPQLVAVFRGCSQPLPAARSQSAKPDAQPVLITRRGGTLLSREPRIRMPPSRSSDLMIQPSLGCVPAMNARTSPVTSKLSTPPCRGFNWAVATGVGAHGFVLPLKGSGPTYH